MRRGPGRPRKDVTKIPIKIYMDEPDAVRLLELIRKLKKEKQPFLRAALYDAMRRAETALEESGE